jgi:predicted nucleic acid-binding protein
VLDRLRLGGATLERELARRRATTLTVLSGFELIRLNRAVLERAAEPFPMRIRTLDAIHVASALLVRARYPALRFATHDEDLAAAAAAEGLPVIGA